MSLNLNHTNNQLLSPVLLFSFTFLILWLILYLLESFAIFKMAKVKKIAHPWLAFFPCTNTYIYGKIAFKENYKTILLIGLYIFSEIFSIGTQIANTNTTSILNGSPQFYSNIFLLLAYMIFNFYAAYKIFKQFSDKATIMLVFSVLSCGFLVPIFLFAIRNNPIKTLDN